MRISANRPGDTDQQSSVGASPRRSAFWVETPERERICARLRVLCHLPLHLTLKHTSRATIPHATIPYATTLKDATCCPLYHDPICRHDRCLKGQDDTKGHVADRHSARRRLARVRRVRARVREEEAPRAREGDVRAGRGGAARARAARAHRVSVERSAVIEHQRADQVPNIPSSRSKQAQPLACIDCPLSSFRNKHVCIVTSLNKYNTNSPLHRINQSNTRKRSSCIAPLFVHARILNWKQTLRKNYQNTGKSQQTW